MCTMKLPGGGTIQDNVNTVRRIADAAKQSAELYSALSPFSGPDDSPAALNAFSYWLGAVSPGGKWAGRLGEPGGNLNYGATARAAGIPLGVALRGAGAAEQAEALTGRTGSGEKGQGSPFGGPPLRR